MDYHKLIDEKNTQDNWITRLHPILAIDPEFPLAAVFLQWHPG